MKSYPVMCFFYKPLSGSLIKQLIIYPNDSITGMSDDDDDDDDDEGGSSARRFRESILRRSLDHYVNGTLWIPQIKFWKLLMLELTFMIVFPFFSWKASERWVE